MPALEALIRSCVDKDPHSRPSARTVRITLEDLRRQRFLREEGRLSLTQTVSTGRRWPSIWVLSISLAMVLAVVGYLALAYVRRDPPPERDEALRSVAQKKEAHSSGPVSSAKVARISEATAGSKSLESFGEKKRLAKQKRRQRSQSRRVQEDLGTGSLFVFSFADDGEEQWGQLFVDGQYRGDTPQTIVGLSAGTHRVEIRRKGFHTLSRMVVVRPGKRVSATFKMRQR